MFKWQYYSPSANGAFCLSCVLLGDRFPGRACMNSKFQNSQSLLHWNNAVLTFKNMQVMGLPASTFPILQVSLS